jgi:hypothetical protein
VALGAELLNLKSKDEKSELGGQASNTISNVETRGTMQADFIKATESLLDQVIDEMVKKTLGSQFENLAKQRNLPLD